MGPEGQWSDGYGLHRHAALHPPDVQHQEFHPGCWLDEEHLATALPGGEQDAVSCQQGEEETARHDSVGGACPRLKRLSFQVFPNEVRVVNSQERCAVWECKSGLSNRGYSTQWRVYWWRSVSDYWCLSARFILTRAALAAGDDSGACSLLCWVLTLFLLFWQQDAKPLEVYSIEFMVDNNQLGFLGNVWNNLYFTKTINNKESLMIKSFSHKAFLFSCSVRSRQEPLCLHVFAWRYVL